MQPGIPKGSRDFNPVTLRRRQYILEQIKSVFEVYGFQPIETPAMENLSTLMGKYGEEGDRLIFKVLNNGLDNPKNTEKARAGFEALLQGRHVPAFTERALRYDLTIPFARYVVMHQHELAFPFKRYQMQPVWRADRPQKGRYREFWQCDADVVGSGSLLHEAELLAIYRGAFHRMRMPDIELRVNNRKILAGLAEVCDASERLTDITIAIDKLDKIGLAGVEAELAERGIGAAQIQIIRNFLAVTGSNAVMISAMRDYLKSSVTGLKGLDELEEVLEKHSLFAEADWESTLQVDFTLARGLNYYTGFIVEVKTNAVEMGSIGGGGRYDDLTGLFGLKGMPGVGISFGVDRIYDVMDQLSLFPDVLGTGTEILLISTTPDALVFLAPYLRKLRGAGIAAEYYSEGGKLEKQFKYADKRNIPFVGILGEREREAGLIAVKNMQSGEQVDYNLETITALWSGDTL